MSATIFSLLAVTLGFAVLLWWVYSPQRKASLEEHGRIPLDDDKPQQQRRNNP